MAEIEIIKGADNGNQPDTLRQMYPKVNRNFTRVNDQLVGHINSTAAHTAENIAYSGDAPGANVRAALNGLDARIDGIVAQAGNDNTEIVDARGGYTVLGDRLNDFDEQLADLENGTDTSIADAFTVKNVRNSSGKIRIGTFNFYGMRSDDMDIVYRARRYLLNLACDVVGLQETWNGVLRSPGQLQNEFYFDSFFGKSLHNNIAGFDYGTTMLSSSSLTNKTVHLYTMINPALEQRSYSRSVLSVNGKAISWYNTHLSYESPDEITSQISQLYAAVSSDSNTYKIVTGDFNTDDLSYFSDFTNGGYTICNTNLPSYKGTSKAIDNIIISPNLTLDSIEMVVVDDDVSDHNIIYADVSGV